MAGKFWKSWSNERIVRPMGRMIALLAGLEATGRRAQPALVARTVGNIEGPHTSRQRTLQRLAGVVSFQDNDPDP
jgi:hypothetical protein